MNLRSAFMGTCVHVISFVLHGCLIIVKELLSESTEPSADIQHHFSGDNEHDSRCFYLQSYMVEVVSMIKTSRGG